MTDDDLRFSAQEYGVLLQWMMVSDPWPLSELAHNRMKEMLNDEAQARGYDSWIHAHHEFGYDEVEA